MPLAIITILIAVVVAIGLAVVLILELRRERRAFEEDRERLERTLERIVRS
jgi:hypothetical protein